jgi:hypothetical protein
MKTTRGIALVALTFMIGACEDAPTFPELKTEASEADQAAALDQAAAQVAATFADQLARGPVDTTSTTRPQRPDTTRNPTRPQRPDTATTRPQRPDTAVTRPRPDDRGRVDLAVALGGEAVDLAARLLTNGADEQQKRLLAEAKELQRQAEAALKAGHDGRAIELAEAASQTALKAVVLPGGITPQEARMIQDVARDLLRDAKAAVEKNPTDLKRHLLAVAEQLFREGSDQLAGPRGSERGLASLWKSAAISSWLIG